MKHTEKKLLIKMKITSGRYGTTSSDLTCMSLQSPKEKRSEGGKIFEEIMSENFLNLIHFKKLNKLQEQEK